MKEKTHKKLNISLPKELHDWVLKKQAEENKKSALSKTAISTIIAHAVERMRSFDQTRESEQGKGHHDAGAKILRASKSSASLSSMAMKGRSRKTG